MPRESTEKLFCVDHLRHAEYYGMQETFDDLYARSASGETFTHLMDIILKRENILLAYRNIKANAGSMTAGTDGLTIKDVGELSPEEVIGRVRYAMVGSKHGYRPKPVRRKDIPKPHDPSKTRPLGIPCIWDRLIQQCIKQVMEPICEAKFSDNSYGFRPNRSVEHAIAATYNRLQLSHLHYVIEFDIKGFFDNVDHTKLIRQIWALGIRDKHLLSKIKCILKAPIKMPDGTTFRPTKGTPQGGIISPLLANIVLNELDQWVESQWQTHPVIKKFSTRKNKSGCEIHSNAYTGMRKTKLKEMYIVRYADDFRIFCRTKTDAEKTKIAITQWLNERLRLEVSQEKTRVVNVKRRYSEFLGFKIKVQAKGNKKVVKSHISDKQFERIKAKLLEQAKRIAVPSKGKTERDEIWLYNSMVTGIQNYYRIATNIYKDCDKLHRSTMVVLTNRLRTTRGSRLRRSGRKLSRFEMERYGKTKTLRYAAGSGEPIYPIGYVHHQKPINKKRTICCYTAAGRNGLHDNLRINTALMLKMMQQILYGKSAEYADNRISLFSAQWGKCAITGKEFNNTCEIHCHHIIPKSVGGADKYANLMLVHENVHKLIHATREDTIDRYKTFLDLDAEQMAKLNDLRSKAGLAKIAM